MMRLGVHSEVARLREVLVHRPDPSLRRLTPGNCKDLLFDDVLWVERAGQEHDMFVEALRDLGVLVHSFDPATMALPEARRWLLDRRVSPSAVGQDMVDEMRGWLEEISPDQLAACLVSGILAAEIPFEPRSLKRWRRMISPCRHYRTSFSHVTAPVGSITASLSTPCIGPRDSLKLRMSRRSTDSIPGFARRASLTCCPMEQTPLQVSRAEM